MKVSKVNHTKAAVGIRKNDKVTKGFIYDNPYMHSNRDLTLVNRITKLNKNAKNLYNILNPQINYSEDKELIKVCVQIRKNMGFMIQHLMKISAKNPETKISLQMEELSHLDANSVIGKQKLNNLYVKFSNPETKETVIHDLVENCLRKSLCKSISENTENGTQIIDIKEVVKKLAIAVINPRNFQQKYTKISFWEITAFLQVLNEDYEKESRIAQIAKSIECQNVKVQPVRVGNDTILHLSNADRDESKKTNYKKYIFKFLTDYTKKNAEGQKQMIIHMRQLILLYYAACMAEDGLPDMEKIKMLPEYVKSEKRFENFTEDVPVYFSEAAQDSYQKMKVIKPDGKDSDERRMKKNLSNDIVAELRKQIRTKYTLCKNLMDSPDFLHDFFMDEEETSHAKENICWLNYISATAEKILIKKKKWKDMTVKTLCRLTFEEWTSLIALKYIDMGKAVYHFALPDLSNIAKQQNVVLGQVKEQYADGLTSFDYERIKAEETLERDLSVYITFAIQNYFRCVCSNEQRMQPRKEDMLWYKEEDFTKILGERNKDTAAKQEAKRRLLQFWGGMSKWEEQFPDHVCDGATVDIIDFVMEIKNKIALVRNSCYHYTASISKDAVTEQPLMKKMFDIEYRRVGEIIFEKYYSNNVFSFYNIHGIKKLADHLYCRQESRPAQIPAFNRIVNQSNIDSFIIKCVGLETWNKNIQDADMRKIFRASFSFLLKEIYYHSFLLCPDIKKQFIQVISDWAIHGKNQKEQNAAKNMMKRIKELDKNISFGELCQTIMTDFHMQNQGNMSVKVKAAKKNKFDEEIFQHFRMLLYAGIRQVFEGYLIHQDNGSLFDCLKHPKARANMDKEEAFQKFADADGGKWKPGLFSDVHMSMNSAEQSTKPVLLAWYTTAHFMNPKQLNLLVGSIKSYIQFINDIDRRMGAARIKKRENQTLQETQKYQRILRVLEFTQLFNGKTTNCLEDYFQDAEDYARHVANYVKLDSPTKYALQAFCEQNAHLGKPNDRIGLYYDATNPIVNRNIVFASMYGMEQILKECIKPIELCEIQELYAEKALLTKVFQRGHCKTIEEQHKLREFQNKKNRVELVNIMTYSELLNDLVGQLVSWAYLRERDLMYFQLGYYYIKLFCGKKMEQDDWMRTLAGTGVDICDGAILYQIAAMYTYALPVYGIKNGEAFSKSRKRSSGAKRNDFRKEYCKGDASIYNAGLFFFEILDEHDFIVEFRNQIDHFKYYACADKSILEYYAEVYDHFFDYDLKLKKSMSYIFKNILARYFVIANTSMGNSAGTMRHKSIGTKKIPSYVYRNCTNLQISEKGLVSDWLIYKVNGKNVKVNARNEIFLAELQNILEYKKVKDI